MELVADPTDEKLWPESSSPCALSSLSRAPWRNPTTGLSLSKESDDGSASSLAVSCRVNVPDDSSSDGSGKKATVFMGFDLLDDDGGRLGAGPVASARAKASPFSSSCQGGRRFVRLLRRPVDSSAMMMMARISTVVLGCGG